MNSLSDLTFMREKQKWVGIYFSLNRNHAFGESIHVLIHVSSTSKYIQRDAHEKFQKERKQINYIFKKINVYFTSLKKSLRNNKIM